MRRQLTTTSILILLAIAAGLALTPGVCAGEPQYRVAVLTPGLSFAAVLEGLRDGLAQLGYRDGQNVTYLVEDTHGYGPEVSVRAAALVATKPDVLVTVATSHTTVAKRATATVPIVFAWVGDPVRSGLIAGYASSGNNLTGVTSYAGPLAGKRLELLKDASPRIRRVLTLVATNDSISETTFDFARDAAGKLGLELVRRDVSTAEDISRVLHAIPSSSIDAIYHVPSGLVGAHIDRLIARSKADRIPLIVHDDEWVNRGALLSYGTEGRSIGVQAAKIVAKVLAGAKPSDIPTQTPEKVLFSVNVSTAKAIRLTIPRNVLDRVDRFVE